MSGIRRLLLSVTIGLALVGVVILAAGTQTRAYAAAVTRYVAPGGVCGGASPCYANVQSAVNAAVAGDEIRVSAGTYTGVTSQGGLSQAVYISKSITLRGGFTTSDWTSPDPEANPRQLDSQVLGRVVTVLALTSPSRDCDPLTGAAPIWVAYGAILVYDPGAAGARWSMRPEHHGRADHVRIQTNTATRQAVWEAGRSPAMRSASLPTATLVQGNPGRHRQQQILRRRPVPVERAGHDRAEHDRGRQHHGSLPM